MQCPSQSYTELQRFAATLHSKVDQKQRSHNSLTMLTPFRLRFLLARYLWLVVTLVVILVDLLTAMPGMKKSIGGVGSGFGEQNGEGGRLIDFAVSHDLVVVYTLFKIRNSIL